MLVAAVIAVLAVGLGAALTLLSESSPRVLGPLRTFATVAALAVVGGHLLPESLHELSGRGALAFVIALIAPVALHWIGERRARHDHGTDGDGERLELEAGYAGLALHHVGDGLGVGVYATLPGGATAHLDVIVALVAHTVPLVAVLALAYVKKLGPRAALLRVAGLALASVVGVLLTSVVPLERVEAANAWVAAIASGLLLHVVTHDVASDLPRTRAARALDLLAVAAGIGVVWLGAHGHAEAGHADDELLHRSYELLLRAALPFALGLAAAALVTLAARVRVPNPPAGGALPLAVHGVVRALARPFAPAASAPSAELAQRLAAPAVGLPALALTVGFFGIELAAVRFAAALALPLLVIAVLAFNRDDEAESPAETGAEPPRASSFDDWFDHLSVALSAGVLAAALLDTYVAPGALLPWSGSPAELVAVSLFASIFSLPLPAAIPIAWVLVQKGLSPGAAVLALLLLPVLDAGVLARMARSFGVLRTAVALLWTLALGWVLAFLQNRFGTLGAVFEARGPLRPAVEVVLQVCAVLLAVLVLRRLAAVGARGWLAAFATRP